MTDRFQWHPKARLSAAGQEVGRAVPQGPVADATAEGLAQVIGLPAFRVGAPDQPPPEEGRVPTFETLTSGSTGTPRRIRRTQGSWIASFKVNAGLGIGPGARVAVLGRLVHSLSLYGAIEGLHLGAAVHLLDTLRPDRQGRYLKQQRISHLYATPAQLRMLSEGQETLPDLQRVLVGGSKLDPALRGRFQALAPAAAICEFYGAAETSFITLSDSATPAGSVGRPYPGVALTLDAAGELWVKSPYLFMDYAGSPGGARWRDGWLSVGEIARMEDGFLYLHGRAGRMVTVADQNVFPEEIEALIEAMPGIRRAAVLPMADTRRGHSLVAFVQGDSSTEPAVLASLRGQLGATRAPKKLVWIQDWPALPSGKTDLRALEALLPWPA
ncbi:AMP-binding protein [Tabrizicola caldifontis]|uniref:AMP-binding protein n=1 Tax=Tabrizicola caldifontis TaxID=2528036 RepID=UPI001081DD09|nr:AMP-binding protein [Rhodobacter sp. YIM 73028]